MNAYVGDVRGFFLDHDLEEIELTSLEPTAAAWINQKKFEWAAKTTQRKLTSLRSYGVYLGIGEILKYYSAPRAARSEPKPLEGGIESVMRLIEMARSDSERALVALTGLCGMRVGEALARKPEEFDIGGRVIRIVRGKGMKDRLVPISEGALEAMLDAVAFAKLWARPRVVEMSDRRARRCITQLAAKAGIPGVASHMLRATFATAAYEASGHDIVAVKDLLGHGHVTTTQVYVGRKLDDLRSAVNFSQRPRLGV